MLWLTTPPKWFCFSAKVVLNDRASGAHWSEYTVVDLLIKKSFGKNPEDFFSPILTLADEPTSNLDALNEGMILKSLQEARGDRTVVLVSHRTSTMNLADVVVRMGAER